MYISAFCSKLYTAQPMSWKKQLTSLKDQIKLLYCTCRLNITCAKSVEAQVKKLGKPHFESIQFPPIQPLVELAETHATIVTKLPLLVQCR